MDFNPNPDEYLHIQEQTLMKKEHLSSTLKSSQNELLEFGTCANRIFNESSFTHTYDWIDDSKLMLNYATPDYMCDFLEDDFMYLNELVTLDDPVSQAATCGSKLQNNDQLPKVLQDKDDAEVCTKSDIVVAENKVPKGLSKAAASRKKEKKIYNKSANVATLNVDEIQKYFDMPISAAAKKMNVGLTVLKKRCRELKIMRWPHRKIMSLKSLIDNVKELGLEKELEKIENHKNIVEKMPQVELTDTMKKLRQTCFKAKYKKKKQMRAAGRLHCLSN